MGKHARERACLAEEPAERRQGGKKEQGNSEPPSLWLEARQDGRAKSLECQGEEPGPHPGATVEPLLGREGGALLRAAGGRPGQLRVPEA